MIPIHGRLAGQGGGLKGLAWLRALAWLGWCLVLGRVLGAGWDAAAFPVGVDGSRVYSVVAPDGSGGLLLGGAFTQVGNVLANRVARWDGVQWRPLSSEGAPALDGVNGSVLAVAVGQDGAVYVGGAFSSAGGVPAWNVARWDGRQWSALGGGLSGGVAPVVRALAVDAQGRVLVGGTFQDAGGVAVENMAIWDGQRWNAWPGGGVRSDGVSAATVHALAWRGSRLWVGGSFDAAGEVASAGIAEWDGVNWTSPQGGVGHPGFLPFVRSVWVRGNDVFVGGSFSRAGAVSAANVARWDGSTWNPVGAGADGVVSVLRTVGTDLVMGGGFRNAGDVAAPGLARWNGARWDVLDGGVGGPEPVVTALEWTANGLWVAGNFNTAGDLPAERSARWTPTNLPPTARVVAPVAGSRMILNTPGATVRVGLSLEASDPDGRVASVEWHDGAQRLGVTTNAPFGWEAVGVGRGTHFFWARVLDDRGVSSDTSPVDVDVDLANTLPVVRIEAPASGTMFDEGARMVFRAVATDADGRVERVDFMDDSGRLLTRDLLAPFEHVVGAAIPGALGVRAVAIDDRGGRTTSERVVVQVNARPVVRIVSPVDGAAFVVTNEVKIVAEASDADGRVERLTLLRDGRPIGSTATEPYRFALVNVPAGTNTYHVVAMDDAGSMATSAPVVIQHQAIPLPYAKPRTYLGMEGGETNFVAPAAITLRAETVTQPPYFQFHQFLVSGPSFGPVPLNNTYSTTNPSVLVVSNLAVGSYEFRAVGTDLFGATATSAPVAVTVRSTAAPGRYRVVMTSALGGSYPTPNAIGPDGTVVGYSDITSGSARVHGFRWTAGVVTDLTPEWERGEAWDINASGTVLGLVTVEDPGWNGMFLLGPGGSWVKASGPAVLPMAVNDRGHVVGRTRPGAEWSRPFLWRGGGTVEVLGEMEGEARDIDGRGRVVGWRVPLREPVRAFLWDDGVFTDLTAEASQAWGINDAGQVVGVVGESDPERRAFVWSEGRMQILGSLPGHNAWGASINASGTVAGWGRAMGAGMSDRAMVWKDGTAFDLNALVDGTDGFQLRRAVAINDRGQVAGIAVHPATWQTRVFLATPSSLPSAPGTDPVVRWNSPQPESPRPSVGVPVEWSVDVTDADGPVRRVEFRLGNVVVATAAAPPFRIDWIPAEVGLACLSVAAWDADGRVTLTEPRCLQVLPAPAPFDVVDLGAVSDVESGATAINGRGDIVGFTRDGAFVDVGAMWTPFRWTGVTQAAGIADDGTIAVRDGSRSALFRAGQFFPLPFLSDVSSETGLRAINGRGVAVGWSLTETRLRRAVRYQDGVLRNLGTLPGHVESDAFGINDAGDVVGWSSKIGEAKAVRWDAAGTISELPGLVGFPVSRATAIHASGAIAGLRMNASERVEGALWADGSVSVIRDLGIGGVEPAALDRFQRVVGTASGRAFLWVTNKTHDLNALVPPGTRWILQAALGMNDAGQVVGVGQRSPADPTARAFLLQPNPAVQTQFSHQAPSVELALEDASTTRIEGDPVTLVAAVRTQSGVIERVSFFEDGRWAGDVTRRPYRWTATNRPAGTASWTAVAFDRWPSSGTSAPVAVTVRALPTNAPRVAVVGVGNAASVPWVRAALIRTLRFSAVDGFTVTRLEEVPTAAALGLADVLLVHGQAAATTAAMAGALGEVIASRVANGVGMVAAQQAGITNALAPSTGALAADGWLPWTATGSRSASRPTWTAMVAGHPLMEGVARLAGGPDMLLLDPVRIAPGGVEVARWSGGTPMVVTREIGRARTVGLNLFPAPVGQRFDSWDATGDGVRLLANALTWAARDATRTNGASLKLAVAPPASGEQPFHLPGEPIRLLPTNGVGWEGVKSVQWFTNGARAGAWTPGSGSLTWSNAPVGQHQVAVTVERADGTVVASVSGSVRVDSRMTASIVAPVNGGSALVPGTLEIVVGVTNLDAPVVRVEFLRNGTERLGMVTNVPYTWRYTLGVGVQSLSARVTDALGAVRVTDTVQVTAYNPSSPQVTSWRGGTNAWASTNAWTAGVPRSQDRALLEGGRALMSGFGGFASNLVVGATGQGGLTVDGVTLRVGRALTLGDAGAGDGDLLLTGGGNLTVATLAIGGNGSGAMVQRSGTVTANEVVMAGNPGSRAAYNLVDGLLTSKGLNVWGPAGAEGFVQRGGTNRVNGFLVVGPRSQRTGRYRMEGGLTETVGMRLASGRVEPATLELMGGRLVSSGLVTVGTEGAGTLVVRGGVAQLASLTTGSSGVLDVQAREGTAALGVSGTATLRGRMVVRLPEGLQAAPGVELALMRYGSVDHDLASVELPPGRDGVSWGVEFRASEAVLVARVAVTEVVVSPVEDGLEPGVFTRWVRITNPGRDALRGMRIYVPGLPSGVELLNKSGAEDGVPFVEHAREIPAGGTAEVTLQFLTLTPGRPVGATAVLTVEDATTATPFRPPFLLQAPALNGDGSLSLRFDPEPNVRYVIEYSRDMAHWDRVPQTLLGTGGTLLWEDNGPPKTASAPGTDAIRFYRVIPAGGAGAGN
ncbi:MAG: Ig-like domain-containing protein [Verrucomicrobiota bacterium]|jgi:probable HAF family extracellular repeat protein